jgi:hypothetical protein
MKVIMSTGPKSLNTDGVMRLISMADRYLGYVVSILQDPPAEDIGQYFNPYQTPTDVDEITGFATVVIRGCRRLLTSDPLKLFLVTHTKVVELAITILNRRYE